MATGREQHPRMPNWQLGSRISPLAAGLLPGHGVVMVFPLPPGLVEEPPPPQQALLCWLLLDDAKKERARGLQGALSKR